ncbi:hypothetical protein SHO565_30300 [Streptomyces sp. HO565]
MRRAVSPDAARVLSLRDPLSTRETVDTCNPSRSAMPWSVTGPSPAMTAPRPSSTVPPVPAVAPIVAYADEARPAAVREPARAGQRGLSGFPQTFGANVWARAY